MTETNDVLACFVYGGSSSQENPVFSEESVKGDMVGSLQVVDRCASEQAVLDQIVCTATVLIERQRRRGRNRQKPDKTYGFMGALCAAPAIIYQGVTM